MLKPKLVIFILAAASFLAAETKGHGTNVRETTLHVSPGNNTEKLVKLERGRDLVVLEQTNIDNRQWIKVYATIPQEERAPREITGWTTSNGIVTASTPNGDQIIFGEAVDSESQAEQRGGRKGAAQDAMRLYYRLTEIFSNSPMAGEAMWRSADIRWQLEKQDVLARPSAREMDPDVRNGMEEHWLKELEKKFPHTKWSDLAAYDLMDNKLCGEWKGLAKCPEKESDLYEHYAHEHPQSPKAGEALFNAAWRQAALVEIYRINNENDKSGNARKKAISLAQEIASQYGAQGDWKPRALDLVYKLEQNVPIYGQQAD